MADDYRNTDYCPCLNELKEKKDKVVELVKQDHSKAVDMHKYISRNEREYKLKFIEAYNGKCCYCGVSISIIPKVMFEIDHFVYEKSVEFNGSKAKAGFIENLKLSCHTCNHKKSSFEFPVDERKKFDPDFNSIKEIYERDDKYYITISDSYKTNQVANEFYKLLKLGAEIRRLDYLLISMIGLNRKMGTDSKVLQELNRAIDFLRIKRNIISTDI